MKKLALLFTSALSLCFPSVMFAATSGTPLNLNGGTTAPALLALALFIGAYALVMTEEFTHLRKSKPVIVAAGFIWIIIGWMGYQQGVSEQVSTVVKHYVLEFGEIFLFLLVAMVYVNTLEERQVFEKLRAWLVRRGFSFRKLFWITGILAFFISPIADNLTTALLMCAVVMAVGGTNLKFVSLACINVVVAANAGGAFSPFGDVTTLMVWQQNMVPVNKFIYIFVPSVVSYVIPAVIMHFAVPKVQPEALNETVHLKFGAKRVIALFLLTITTTVLLHHFLHLPPMIGMMTGLGYLLFFAHYIKRMEIRRGLVQEVHHAFDIFRKVKRAEWDTLLFFYGIILSVGGLATLGYLSLLSTEMYQNWGAALPAAHSATPANVAVGIISAIIDNIPVMFAVLTMKPPMSEGQWLLVTLTAGIGGSMLSIGSAAGVAVMGQAKGKYTFMGHLKWAWAIALGYFAGVACHIWLNADLF